MNRTALALLMITVAQGPLAIGAVTMSANPNAPTLGANDQSQLLDDAQIPGGTAPGGGTYNSQAFTDNAGPPGQTFTTPGTPATFGLSAISVKGAGDSGGVIGSATTTWAIRISEVMGTSLTPVKTFTAIPTLPAGTPSSSWVTFSFTGSDRAILDASTQYAFEIYTTGGWFGIDGTPNDASYAGGTAFNSAGPGRSFTDNTTGNLANHGYDRTFVASLIAGGVPGDVDGDGDADIDDYVLIRNAMETAVSVSSGPDLTGDGFVDLNDFRAWTNAAPPEIVASLSIPEPAASLLGATSLLAAAYFTGRRSRSRI